MKHETDTFHTSGSMNLFTQTWKPDADAKGTLVIAHGLHEHSGRYQHVAEYFVRHEFNVYTLDHRGHGRSRGDTLGYFDRFDTLSDDLRRFIEQVRTQEKTGPLFLLGHSMGGLIALYYTIRHQAMLKGVITSGAPLTTASEIAKPKLWMGRLLNRINPKAGAAQLLNTSDISHDANVVKAYETDSDVYLGKIRARVGTELLDAGAYVRANLSSITLPILILHGGADKVVSPTYAQTIFECVSSADKTLKVYPGLYHEILNEPEKDRVLGDIWGWLSAHQATGGLRAAAIPA
ncbi:MAG: lysophospholipase [Anaerolineae bacterium]|nr:lysophospholipase [Anaerolineae bacterium]